jgi:signal transduction histidine kinase
LANRDPKSEIPDETGATDLDQVAYLAHEIKNSMTSISTFIQLLPAKWNDERFRGTFYPVVCDAALRITHLVNEMLDFGKKQSFQLTSTNLKDLVEGLVASKKPLAEQRRLRFHLHVDVASPVIRIVYEKIREAIDNLLQNALEATPEGGDISIRVTDDRLPGGRPAIRLEIRDSGPGIDREMQAHIFEPYMSTKTHDPQPCGTGLGLHIAKNHIEAHGGTITFESPRGAGAVFRIMLPVERRRV